jgi:hypothetical protein
VLDLSIALAAAIGRLEAEQILKLGAIPEPVVASAGRKGHQGRRVNLQPDELRRMYVDEGLSTTKIGEMIGTSSSTTRPISSGTG